MEKPDYCPQEVYDNPPCGYCHCLACTTDDIQCEIVRNEDGYVQPESIDDL